MNCENTSYITIQSLKMSNCLCNFYKFRLLRRQSVRHFIIQLYPNLHLYQLFNKVMISKYFLYIYTYVTYKIIRRYIYFFIQIFLIINRNRIICPLKLEDVKIIEWRKTYIYVFHNIYIFRYTITILMVRPNYNVMIQEFLENLNWELQKKNC